MKVRDEAHRTVDPPDPLCTAAQYSRALGGWVVTDDVRALLALTATAPSSAVATHAHTTASIPQCKYYYYMVLLCCLSLLHDAYLHVLEQLKMADDLCACSTSSTFAHNQSRSSLARS